MIFDFIKKNKFFIFYFGINQIYVHEFFLKNAVGKRNQSRRPVFDIVVRQDGGVEIGEDEGWTEMPL